MKKVLIVLFVFLVGGGGVTAQEEVASVVELYFITENMPSQPIMSLTLQNESQCWGVNEGFTEPTQGEYFFTNNYNEPSYIPDGNNLGNAHSEGFDFVNSIEGVDPIFAYGLYKVINNLNDKYFYIDYRDQRAGYYNHFSPPSIGHDIDVWLRFDANNAYFKYTTQIGQGFSYHEVNEGEVIRIWEVKGKGLPQTYFFPNFWENALAVVNNGSNNPKLVWSAYPSSSITIQKYKIYRKLEGGNWQYLAYVNGSTYEYTDNQVSLSQRSSIDASYKVMGIYNTTQSTEYSNTVTARVNQALLPKGAKDEADIVNDYILNQNYPNPFNPETIIRFSLEHKSHVSLKVYDSLGRLVADLVNEIKNEGKHSVAFNGSSLTSGVYFYTLKAEGKIISKKMILSK